MLLLKEQTQNNMSCFRLSNHHIDYKVCGRKQCRSLAAHHSVCYALSGKTLRQGHPLLSFSRCAVLTCTYFVLNHSLVIYRRWRRQLYWRRWSFWRHWCGCQASAWGMLSNFPFTSVTVMIYVASSNNHEVYSHRIMCRCTLVEWILIIMKYAATE